jgi:hypothetical protein
VSSTLPPVDTSSKPISTQMTYERHMVGEREG